MKNFDTDHLSPAEQIRLAAEFAKDVDTSGWKSRGDYDGRYDNDGKNRRSMSIDKPIPASCVYVAPSNKKKLDE